jgi:REP-associated tyrosine transposase
MTLFKNTFRVETTRLKYWDYSNPGLYFITICTNLHSCDFGEIRNAQMVLNEQGKTVGEIWKLIPTKFENVVLDEFIVMPNHVHGIIIITQMDSVGDKNAIGDADTGGGRDAINRVSTERGGITGEKNPMLSNHTLGKIIRWYKGRSTFEIHKNKNPGFKWQSRFYDHIIRNEKSYLKIKEYTRYNPNKWEDDRYYEHQ